MALLRAHYRPGVPLAQAFAGALAELFAEDGLLIFEPARAGGGPAGGAHLPAGASTSTQAIAAAVWPSGPIAARRPASTSRCPCRPGCRWCSSTTAASPGPRYRLERRSGTGAATWTLAGGGRKRVDAHELRGRLADDPLRFSTSALLRPLVQDTLFPTAAYVGGPAELGYFAQLRPAVRSASSCRSRWWCCVRASAVWTTRPGSCWTS